MKSLLSYRPAILGSLAVFFICALHAGGLWAQPTTAPASAQPAPQNLTECRTIALAQQPALAAYQASLAAAQARLRAVEHMGFSSLIAHDIPYRRKQAAISVGIAEAALVEAEGETRYAVTRTYIAAVYARQQLEVADRALDNLKQMQEATQRLLDIGAANVTARDRDRVAVYIPVAQGRREEAVQGVELALAALREAMGVDATFNVQPAANQLPWFNPPVSKEDIINLTLARRGEMIQAAGAMDITCLEVKAQGTSHLPSLRTFASAGDVHARLVPQGISNGEYRPGAVPLEMPPTLVGHRLDRKEQATDLYARAQAVADKARGLLTLEAESAYLKWLETSRKVVKFREAADLAEKLARALRNDLEKQGARVTPEEVLNSGVLATELRLKANEALFQYLLSLAALERITAGGFNPGFVP